jgi:hypothetical protein
MGVHFNGRASHKRVSYGRVSHGHASHRHIPYGHASQGHIVHRYASHKYAPRERVSHACVPCVCLKVIYFMGMHLMGAGPPRHPPRARGHPNSHTRTRSPETNWKGRAWPHRKLHLQALEPDTPSNLNVLLAGSVSASQRGNDLLR